MTVSVYRLKENGERKKTHTVYTRVKHIEKIEFERIVRLTIVHWNNEIEIDVPENSDRTVVFGYILCNQYSFIQTDQPLFKRLPHSQFPYFFV